MECRRQFRGKEIWAKIEKLDCGTAVTLAGGDSSHVGAVSVADANGVVQTIVLPGHKDHYIGEVWARWLYAKTNAPVSVTAGIHYDHITKDEIAEVQALAQEMLDEILKQI
jgi:hypothetical protein